MSTFESEYGYWALIDEENSTEGGFEFRKELVKFLKGKLPNVSKNVIEENLYLLPCKKIKISIEFSEEDIKEFEHELDEE